jgi:RNA polymerase sigma-70 factor (ECF subfamily)
VTVPERDDGAAGEWAAERARLVRLCAHLSGDPSAAEDLAHETLYEALRNAHKLHDPSGRSRWLSAIARNVCLRWARSRGRDLSHLAPPASRGDAASPDPSAALADPFDLEIELERGELADLLDRAMALLPPETRDVLVHRYVHDSPPTEIAARLGLTEKAVSMRLSRGKLLLRRLLSTDLREHAETYGLLDESAGDGWRETRIWCPGCGRRRLVARIPRPPGTASFRCPGCAPIPGESGWNYPLSHALIAPLIGGITSPRPLLNKATRWLHERYLSGMERGETACTRCGHPARLERYVPSFDEATGSDLPGFLVLCHSCSEIGWTALGEMLRGSGEMQLFQREHPKVRMLPGRQVEAGGRAAIVTSFESLTAAARIDVVTARDTFEVIGVHGAPSPTTNPQC